LARTNGWRLSSLFTTATSRNWTRSNVVKRAPQLSHWRRRRIAALSSVGRESLTWLLSWAQNGQRKLNSPLPEQTETDDRRAGQCDHPASAGGGPPCLRGPQYG